MIFKYLGRDYGVHHIAHLMNSNTNNGSADINVCSVLKSLAKRENLEIEHLFKFDDLKQFQKMVRQYNNYAKRQKMPEVVLSFIDNSEIQVCNMTKTLEQFDFKTYKRYKVKSGSTQMNHFFRTLCTSIDHGLPLAWSMMTGFNSDDNTKNQLTGHACVITGYNKSTREILFADPNKRDGSTSRMSLEDAWTSNVGIYRFTR